MAYRHGVYVSEVPTSILSPTSVSAGLPVVFGTAPVNMTEDPAATVNRPVLCYSYAEAVAALGFSSDFESYTLCEFMRSHFALFAMAPVVFVNVLDPATAKADVTDDDVALSAGAVALPSGILPATLVVKSDDSTTTYDLDTDYTVAFDMDGGLVVSRVAAGSISTDTAALKVSYTHLDASAVDAADVIGGIDPNTGARTGLELVDEIFPRFRLIPGMILAPKFSTDPAVAAVMSAKATGINQHFEAIALVDVPTDTVTNYTDVAAYKNDNNLVAPNTIVCWPKVKLGNEQFHLSTQLAGVICKTDGENEDVPYVSPSNKNIQAVATVLQDGTEVWLGPDQAAYMNGEGIVTALNFIGGWKAWGNRTAAYPAVTDPKDAFIPIRRMFNWVANTLTTTYWQRLDFPLNRRQIDTILDSANIWLNGLAARQFILGGRVEFLEDENPTTDLMDGIARFHVYITPPSPNLEIDFILEYDPAYLDGLFGG